MSDLTAKQEVKNSLMRAADMRLCWADDLKSRPALADKYRIEADALRNRAKSIETMPDSEDLWEYADFTPRADILDSEFSGNTDLERFDESNLKLDENISDAFACGDRPLAMGLESQKAAYILAALKRGGKFATPLRVRQFWHIIHRWQKEDTSGAEWDGRTFEGFFKYTLIRFAEWKSEMFRASERKQKIDDARRGAGVIKLVK